MAGRERLPREPAGQMRESGGSSTGHNRETTGRANDYPFTKGRSPAPPPQTHHTTRRAPPPPPPTTHAIGTPPAPPTDTNPTTAPPPSPTAATNRATEPSPSPRP